MLLQVGNSFRAFRKRDSELAKAGAGAGFAWSFPAFEKIEDLTDEEFASLANEAVWLRDELNPLASLGSGATTNVKKS